MLILYLVENLKVTTSYSLDMGCEGVLVLLSWGRGIGSPADGGDTGTPMRAYIYGIRYKKYEKRR